MSQHDLACISSESCSWSITAKPDFQIQYWEILCERCQGEERMFKRVKAAYGCLGLGFGPWSMRLGGPGGLF